MAAKHATTLSGFRWGLYLGLAVLGIWAALQVGPLAFYQTFQRPMEARDRGGVIWAAPVASRVEPWRAHAFEGSELPLPPEEPASIDSEDGRIVADFGERSIIYRPAPPGLLRAMLAETRGRAGALPLSSAVSDQRILEGVAQTTPAGYQSGWGADRRGEYASRLLVKLLLWDDRPIRRLEAARSDDGAATSVFVEYSDGSAKAIVVAPGGTWFISLPNGAPGDWACGARSFLVARSVELPAPHP